jgi:hypothetical protein
MGGVERRNRTRAEATLGSPPKDDGTAGSWYRVDDIKDDGCRETIYKAKNLDDHTRIFLLEDENIG